MQQLAPESGGGNVGTALLANFFFLYNAHFQTTFPLVGSPENGTKGEQTAGRRVRRPEEEPAARQAGGSGGFKQQKSPI